MQEKTTAELKSGLAYADIPTPDAFANTAWQKLNILAHNLQTSFQIEVMPQAKPPTRKRTTAFLVRSIRTLRYELRSNPSTSSVVGLRRSWTGYAADDRRSARQRLWD